MLRGGGEGTLSIRWFDCIVVDVLAGFLVAASSDYLILSGDIYPNLFVILDPDILLFGSFLLDISFYFPYSITV